LGDAKTDAGAAAGDDSDFAGELAGHREFLSHWAAPARLLCGPGRAACLVVLQMQSNLAVNHVPLALANLRHVGCDRTDHGAELRGVMREMRDPCAPDLVLAGQVGDVGTGTPDPPALDDGSSSPRLRLMPGQ